MTQYKLTNDSYTGESSTIIFGGLNIPLDPENRDYQQFIQDVAEQGYDIVEGPDVVEPSYAELRAAEYPPLEEQLDKIYHSGVTNWKKDIKAIKDKHPKTITGGTTIGDVPNWVQEAADNWTFNKQLREYVNAVERLELDAIVASDDIPATVDVSTTDPETMEVSTTTVPNPVIVKDEEERAAAQSVVDATPQSVIDSINN
tara:strand:- start:218 stop:820 length:603 start_codon:yes stop_codon:yes gene_type:complete